MKGLNLTIQSLLLTALLVPALGVNRPLFSQTAATPGNSILEEVRRLEELKENDPEAYRTQIREKKQSLKNKISSFKENHPEEFQSFSKRQFEFKKKKLLALKERNPERFQEFAERRKNRWKQFAQKNPEKWNEIKEKRAQRFAASEDRQIQHPERPGMQESQFRQKPQIHATGETIEKRPTELRQMPNRPGRNDSVYSSPRNDREEPFRQVQDQSRLMQRHDFQSERNRSDQNSDNRRFERPGHQLEGQRARMPGQQSETDHASIPQTTHREEMAGQSKPSIGASRPGSQRFQEGQQKAPLQRKPQRQGGPNA